MIICNYTVTELTVEAATPGGLNEQAIKFMRESEHFNVQTQVSVLDILAFLTKPNLAHSIIVKYALYLLLHCQSLEAIYTRLTK